MDYTIHLRPSNNPKQLVSPGESAPKNARVCQSTNNIMATVFWNARGLIHIEYLRDGSTITGEYFAK